MTAVPLLFALLTFPQMRLAIPLVLAFSFCCAASREEDPRRIVARGARNTLALAVFMAIVAIALRFVV